MPVAGLEAVPRYSELVYRLLGEDVDFIPPGFVLEDDRAEYSYLKRENLWSLQPVAIGPTPGQFSFVQVRNPAGSGRVAVVQGFFAKRTTAGDVSVALTNVVRGATGSSAAILRDQRGTLPLAINRPDPLIVEVGTAATFATDVQIFTFTTAANAWIQIPCAPIVLGPGLGAVITSATLNEQLVAEMHGYSRIARPEELTP